MGIPVVRSDSDPWIALVHHCLAYLPVSCEDASSLYNEDYIRWAEAGLPRPADARRTLTQDAERLAALYDATPGAHLLQGFASLHGDVDDFLRTTRFALEDNGWPDHAVAEGVRALARSLGSELVELFRIALWGETHAGYLALHDTLRPQLRSAAATLAESLTRLQPRLPNLGDVEWMLCPPLGRAGRLSWSRPHGQRSILVGAAVPELGVPVWAPLLQGVHEYLLSEVHASVDTTHRDDAPVSDTRPGRPGWSHFFVPELITLCLDCRVHGRGFTAAPLRQWLTRFYPDGEADLAPQLAEAGLTPEHPCPTGSEGFVSWLARGDVLPSSLRPPFESLCSAVGRDL